MPDNSICLPKIPILSLKGKIGHLILLESGLLSILHQSMPASLQSIAMLYYSPVPLIEMGLRRAKGLQTSRVASYQAYMNGFFSTSHVKVA